MGKLETVFSPHDRLRINLTETEEGYEVIFEGFIDFKNAESLLTPIFSDFHERMLEKAFRAIVLDIKKLTFINSDGIKAMIQWVLKLKELPKDKKYKIIFKINEFWGWQEISIGLLKQVGSRLISISK